MALLLALVGLVIQATLFRRFDWLTPDLVVLVVCVSALTLAPIAELLLGFFAGALVDVSIASSAGSTLVHVHGGCIPGHPIQRDGGFRFPGGRDMGWGVDADLSGGAIGGRDHFWPIG